MRIQQRWSALNKKGGVQPLSCAYRSAWIKKGDLKRDEESDRTSRAKEKRRRVEEVASMKRRKKGHSCMGRQCMFKGPGE